MIGVGEGSWVDEAAASIVNGRVSEHCLWLLAGIQDKEIALTDDSCSDQNIDIVTPFFNSQNVGEFNTIWQPQGDKKRKLAEGRACAMGDSYLIGFWS